MVEFYCHGNSWRKRVNEMMEVTLNSKKAMQSRRDRVDADREKWAEWLARMEDTMQIDEEENEINF